MSRIGLLIASCLLLAAQDPCPEPPDATKADLKKLQGTWKVEKLESGGKAQTDKVGIRMIVKDDMLTIKEDKRDEVTTFKLNGKKKPKEIDIAPKNGPKMGVPGIYKLDRDTLSICFVKGGDGPRPKGF